MFYFSTRSTDCFRISGSFHFLNLPADFSPSTVPPTGCWPPFLQLRYRLAKADDVCSTLICGTRWLRTIPWFRAPPFAPVLSHGERENNARPTISATGCWPPVLQPRSRSAKADDDCSTFLRDLQIPSRTRTSTREVRRLPSENLGHAPPAPDFNVEVRSGGLASLRTFIP